MKNKKKTQPTGITGRPHSNQAQPFIVHVRELRRRLFYVVLSVILFGVLGYFIQEQIIGILLRPARGQQFIYTTAGGGFNFLVNICIYFGLAASLPLMMYHLFHFLEPLFRDHSRLFILRCSVFSTLLAVTGAVFGYYVGLPAALQFLLHQFSTSQIKPLLTIQDYVSFVMIYIVGFALLFQIPLILLLINRITRLRPRKLLGYQRFVIAGAFVAAALITPSGDMVNQLIMAGPIIAMYQFGVAAVWLYNRRTSDHVAELRQQDELVRAERQRRMAGEQLTGAKSPQVAKPLPPAVRPMPTPSVPGPARTTTPVYTRRPVAYFQDIRPQTPVGRAGASANATA